MVFISAAIGLGMPEEARRVYQQMPPLAREAFDALEAEQRGP